MLAVWRFAALSRFHSFQRRSLAFRSSGYGLGPHSSAMRRSIAQRKVLPWV
jgi:hypothetical protein